MFTYSKKNKIRHKPSLLTVSAFIVLVVYSLILLSVFIWAFVFSFADFENDIWFSKTKSYLVWPSKWSFDNVAKVYEYMKITVPYYETTRDVMMPEMFLNSVLFALGGSFFVSLAPCMMGYIASKFRFKFNGVIDATVLTVMILPIVGALPSTVQLVYGLHLDNSFIGLWIMNFGFTSMYYFVFKAAFKEIPDSLSESAKMDGAGNLRVYVKIMMPLVKITFFSVMLIQFIGIWNNYTTPLVFAPDKPTAAYGLFTFIQSTRISEPTLKMTGAMILMIPILLIYATLNKKLMGNLTMGGVKG